MIELTILSAKEKRKENEINQAVKKAKDEAYKALRLLRVEKLTAEIFNFSKAQIEAETFWNSCSVYITDNKIKEWNVADKNELIEAIEKTRHLLSLAGYICNDWYEYSNSWHRQSGKIGYFYIRW